MTESGKPSKWALSKGDRIGFGIIGGALGGFLVVTHVPDEMPFAALIGFVLVGTGLYLLLVQAITSGTSDRASDTR